MCHKVEKVIEQQEREHGVQPCGEGEEVEQAEFVLLRPISRGNYGRDQREPQHQERRNGRAHVGEESPVDPLGCNSTSSTGTVPCQPRRA